MNCNFKNCNQKHHGKGYCYYHYQKLFRPWFNSIWHKRHHNIRVIDKYETTLFELISLSEQIDWIGSREWQQYRKCKFDAAEQQLHRLKKRLIILEIPHNIQEKTKKIHLCIEKRELYKYTRWRKWILK